ncbi:hypothetical protein DKX38_001807 [Salix brachista]|uniref:RING-type domain-containing protein n=1 Tax=Salix brachista TaxID=2182728 RepID=A0A5N5NKG0_9ROSI|nr:hypothetical protein DKX38_001807 [Salix brachista]
MTRPFSFLNAVSNSSATTTGPPPQASATVDSDFMVILAALLCALICVLGLIAVARCAWLRRFSSRNPTPPAPPPPPVSNKGLKKKVLRSLPKQTFSEDFAGKFSDCPICLTEFSAGDEIRVLPQCGHGFHVSCIDTWLGSHSSCPSCRQILVVARCQKCGGLPSSSSSSNGGGEGAETEARLKEREDDANRCNRVLLIDPSFRFKAINKNNDNVENPKEEEEEQQQCVHDVAKAVANKKESGSNATLLDWKKDYHSPTCCFCGKSRQSCPGTAADLVRRGQLRSDRRGMYDSIPNAFSSYLRFALFLCTL